MNELAAQRIIVDAIRRCGGFGFKLNNRFLGGIPDLLLKPKGYPVSIYEVKIKTMPKVKFAFKLGMTPLQQVFLRDFYNAGGYCGVISVLIGSSSLHMAVVPYEIISEADRTIKPTGQESIRPWYLNKSGHVKLDRGKRDEQINDVFIRGAYASH